MYILVDQLVYVKIYKHLSKHCDNRVKFVSSVDNKGYQGRVCKRDDGSISDEDGNILYIRDIFIRQYRSPYPEYKICTSSFSLEGDLSDEEKQTGRLWRKTSISHLY